MPLFLQGQAGELLNGFVECLEVEEPEELDPDTQGTIKMIITIFQMNSFAAHQRSACLSAHGEGLWVYLVPCNFTGGWVPCFIKLCEHHLIISSRLIKHWPILL